MTIIIMRKIEIIRTFYFIFMYFHLVNEIYAQKYNIKSKLTIM